MPALGTVDNHYGYTAVATSTLLKDQVRGRVEIRTRFGTHANPEESVFFLLRQDQDY